MEKDLQELENLKQRLNRKQNPDNEIWILRAVMREVGGYEQLMKLPLSVYNIIAESIISERNAQLKAYNKSHSRR
jgi:hypothetical protein